MKLGDSTLQKLTLAGVGASTLLVCSISQAEPELGQKPKPPPQKEPTPAAAPTPTPTPPPKASADSCPFCGMG